MSAINLTIIKSRKSKSKIQKAYEADTYLQKKNTSSNSNIFKIHNL